jgi:hypothetical protein
MLTSDLARHWKLLAWIWDQGILYMIIHKMFNHEMYDHEMSDHEIYDIMKLFDHEISDH